MWVALLLSVIAVAYNNVVNRWDPFHSTAYVPVNLTFVGAITILSASALELSRTDLGLRGDLDAVVLALGIVAVFALGAFALAGSRHAGRIADKRVTDLRGAALAFYVCVRIPLGTALAEEVLFRGVLFAAWLEAGASTVLAAVWASMAFGLWHVTPTIIGIRMNDPQAGSYKLGAALITAVLLTTTAGLGLTWLRLETGGLVAPIVLHAGINSVGALAAVRAARARGDVGP